MLTWYGALWHCLVLHVFIQYINYGIHGVYINFNINDVVYDVYNFSTNHIVYVVYTSIYTTVFMTSIFQYKNTHTSCLLIRSSVFWGTYISPIQATEGGIKDTLLICNQHNCRNIDGTVLVVGKLIYTSLALIIFCFHLKGSLFVLISTYLE